jgi:threonine/homoserine efflux transporter RhtA
VFPGGSGLAIAIVFAAAVALASSVIHYSLELVVVASAGASGLHRPSRNV